MRDRVPTKPNRYAVYDDNHNFVRYEYHERADEPTEIGTPLNKATLLKDATAELFELTSDAVPDDAFRRLYDISTLIAENKAMIILTVNDTNGKLMKDVKVTGITDSNGNEMFTDSNGMISGFILAGSRQIGISQYADIVDFSKTLSIVAGRVYRETITVTRRNFLKITTSDPYYFSGSLVSVDVTSVGGGGGGGGGIAPSSTVNRGGGGGAGGSTKIEQGVSFAPRTPYSAVIGAGGAAGIGGGSSGGPTNGSAGGTTSFLGVEAAGGAGGKKATSSSGGKGGTGASGGGSGGTGAKSSAADDGANGTLDGFSSFTETVTYGGGGGGGGSYYYNYPGGSGGNLGGGAGGSRIGEYARKTGESGTDGTGGGGGGGEGSGSDTSGGGGNGGSGVVAIRMHV
jgi:hypothetical protein